LQGSGGNITVLGGSDGKFMVDSGIAVSKDKIRAALNTLGAEPVKFVVGTHWHWDHANGDARLHEGGATIVATPKTVKYLMTASRVEEWEHTFQSVIEAMRRIRPRPSMRNGAPSLLRRLGSQPWCIKDFE